MTDFKISLVPLNGKNYPTWKVQCRMPLVKDSLWDIVKGTETLAEDATDESKKEIRCKKVIVLAVDPSLLYLLGEPENSLEKAGGTVSAENMATLEEKAVCK